MKKQIYIKSNNVTAMPFKRLFIGSLFLSLIVICSQNIAMAAIVSPDYVFVANDQYSADFHTRLNQDIAQLANGVDNIISAQITADTVAESDMADDANPRIRTAEGAACEYVYTGLLPATGAGLTTNISAGTAYPKGYRVNKASTTAHTYTSGVWTYVDINSSGDFQYSEVAINATAPSVATNSVRLARVSTDSGAVDVVTDLRKTSCASGPFSAIADASGEGTLSDLFSKGKKVRQDSPGGVTPNGYVQGLFVSLDSTTTKFKVTQGSAYINGKYRTLTADAAVPKTVDNPALGTNGLDTGAIASDSAYYVYAVADRSDTSALSISYSTSPTSPTGVTNYRLLGKLKTDMSSNFTSADVATVHGISDREIISGWIVFNGEGTELKIYDSHNVSGIADGGIGIYTISWDHDFNTGNYAVSGIAAYDTDSGGESYINLLDTTPPAAGSLYIRVTANAAAVDTDRICVLVTGDARQ